MSLPYYFRYCFLGPLGINCCISLPRHFAVVGALVALGIHQYGFFVQQLVSTSIGYIYVPSLNEPLPQIPSNWENLLDQEFQNYNRTGVFNVPEKLQIARISNVTNYTYPNYGQPPCKHFNNEIALEVTKVFQITLLI